MASINSLIISYNLGDWASVLGLFLGLIGFTITIVNVLKSKSAAELAQKASMQVQKELRMLDTVAEFATSIRSMEEIKRLHRQSAWEILPDRYAELRKSLIAIKVANTAISDEHKTTLLSAIRQISIIEGVVEEANNKKQAPNNIPKFNKIISKQIESLHEVLISLQNNVGR